MPQNSNYGKLSRVFSRTDTPSVAVTGTVLIGLDPASNKTRRDRPLVRTPWSETVWYLVRPDELVRLEPFEFVHETHAGSVQLTVALTVSCPTKGMDAAVKALHHASGADAGLIAATRRWLAQHLNANPDLLTSSSAQELGRLGQLLNEHAAAHWGLDLRTRLEPLAGRATDPLRVSPPPFKIHFKDCSQELEITVRATFDRSELDLAALSRLPDMIEELEGQIERRIRSHCAASVTIHAYCFDPDNSILPDTRKLLTELAAEHRLKLDRLEITRGGSGFTDQLREVVVSRPYPIVPHNETITVTCKIRTRLEDAGAYLRSGARPLEAWLEETVDGLLSEVLFGKKRSELLHEWPDLEIQIRSRIAAAGKKIGYRVEAVITAPVMEEWKWTQPFDVDLGEQHSFETKNGIASVPLRVVATIDKINLQKNQRLIDERRNLPAEMQAVMINEIRRYLRSVTPEEYHMKFETFDDTSPGLDVKLANLVRDALAKQFAANVRTVDVTPLPTEESRRLRALLARPDLDLSVPVRPLGDPQFGEVVIRVTIQITGVTEQGWSKFQLRSFTHDDIADALSRCLTDELPTVDCDLLRFADKEGQKLLLEAISSQLRDEAQAVFGLGIAVRSVGRAATSREQLVNKIKDREFDTKVLGFNDEYDEASDSSVQRKRLRAIKYEEDANTLRALLQRKGDLAARVDDDVELSEQRRDIENQLAKLDSKASQQKDASDPSSLLPPRASKRRIEGGDH